MPKSTDTPAAEQSGAAPRYPTHMLLNSKALAGYQKDFAKVLLTAPDYTLQEARDILDQFFKGGKP